MAINIKMVIREPIEIVIMIFSSYQNVKIWLTFKTIDEWIYNDDLLYGQKSSHFV